MFATDPDGEENKKRDYDDDGNLSQEFEKREDGAVVKRTFYSNGKLESERVERDDALESERWLDHVPADADVVEYFHGNNAEARAL